VTMSGDQHSLKLVPKLRKCPLLHTFSFLFVRPCKAELWEMKEGKIVCSEIHYLTKETNCRAGMHKCRERDRSGE
jgi:hypothetical protein